MGFTPTLTFQLLAALVAGGFTTLTASPFELWWLGPVAIGLLYVGLHTLSPGQAALKGWLYGVALFASGTSWVYVSIHDYGYTGVPLAVFLTALFVSVLALFFAGTLWLSRRFIGPRWALLTFGNVVHAFTDPAINVPGVAVYDEVATRHGYAIAHAFIADAFAGKL